MRFKYFANVLKFVVCCVIIKPKELANIKMVVHNVYLDEAIRMRSALKTADSGSVSIVGFLCMFDCVISACCYMRESLAYL